MAKRKSQNMMLAHSKAKVEFYEKYLERYLPIMLLTPYVNTIYIYDVFCGRGVYENGGEGSPVRALKAIVDAKRKHPSDTQCYLRLNDYDPNNIDSVKQYIAKEIPDHEQYCKVQFANVDAEGLLDSMANNLAKTKNNERNLLFIDPYGYKTIHKDTLEKLLKNGKTEIILFLPVSFMHRFKGYAFDIEASEGVAPLRRFTEDFFPDGHPMRNGDKEMDVHEYIENLREAFSYDDQYYTASYQIERDKGTYFALFFMTSNLRGFEKILEVKWGLDEEDGNGFLLEKASPYVQTSLFEEEFAAAKKHEHGTRLRKAILEYLQVPRDNGQMFKFVLKKGYMAKHANEVLKQLQEECWLDVITIATGNPARKGSFYLNYDDVNSPKVKFILKQK